MRTSHSLLLIAGILLVSFNLRPAITAVGPLVEPIRNATGISTTAFGLLTTLPVLTFGIFSIVASNIGRKFGNERSIFLSLFTLTIGIVLRSEGSIPLLYVGTLLIGLGIANCNVLLIGVIKERMPEKLGMMTAVYTMAMSFMASLASGISLPLSENLQLGWERTLSCWAILSILALIVWFPQLRFQPQRRLEKKTVSFSLFRTPLAWQVTVFMGFQSSIFYSMIAWFPGILVAQGVSPVSAGWLLTLAQLAGMIGNFFVPQLAVKLADQRPLALAIASLYAIGLYGIYLSDHLFWIVVFCFLFGIAQGSGISLALTLFALRAKTTETATDLSGMAQSGGYLIAALSPLMVGFMYDLTSTWLSALVLFSIFIFGFAFTGFLAGRDRYVEDVTHEKERLVQ